MKSYTRQELVSAVEKGFSSYIKFCLTHKSSNFFRNCDQERNRSKSLNDFNEITLYRVSESSIQTKIIDEEESLFEVIRSLNSLEKQLIYLKFHEEKTDREIAQALGVSRQAITKAKKKLLIKMKKRLDL